MLKNLAKLKKNNQFIKDFYLREALITKVSKNLCQAFLLQELPKV